MATQSENAVINLVINGQQAITTYRELNRARAEQLRLVQSLNRNDPNYEQQRRQLEELNAAHRTWRAEIMQGTQAINQQNQAGTGFFASMRQGWAQIAASVSVATLAYKGISVAIGFVTELWNGSEQAYDEAQRTQTQLQSVLKSTAGVAGQSIEQLQKYQEELMNLTGVDDDVIAKGEEMLLTFTNVRGTIYEKALPAIVDMTAAMNQGQVSMEGIQTTSILVGKALNDPIAGMTALKKVGVTLDEQQKEQIRTMVKNNDVMGAQSVILKELQKEFGGTAKAIADTDVGAMQKFQTRIGNIQEVLGQWMVSGKNLMLNALDPIFGWMEKVVTSSVVEKLQDEQAELNSLTMAIVSTNENQEIRNRLIDELQQKYPDFIGNISKEAVTNDLLIKKLEAVNEQYRDRIFMAANEERITEIQEKRTKAVKEEIEARKRVAAASGLSVEALARLTDAEVKNLAVKRLAEERQLSAASAGQGTGGANFSSYWEQKALKDADLIINGRKRLAEADKEMGDLMRANGVLQDKLNKEKLADIAAEEKAIRSRMATESAEAKQKDEARLKELETQRKNILGIIDAPSGGPNKGDEEAARRKAEAYAKQLDDIRSEYLKLAEAAKKGTVDDLNAQLAVIDDKYNKVVAKLQKLAKNPSISKEFLGYVDDIQKPGGLRDQEKNGLRASTFTKETSGALADQLGTQNSAIEDTFTQMGTDLQDQQTEAMRLANSEEERLKVKAEYQDKELQLQLAHYEALKNNQMAWGGNTTAIERKISDTKAAIAANDVKNKELSVSEQNALDQKRFEFARLITNSLASLVDITMGNSKVGIAMQKAVTVAQIAIDTASAISATTAQMAKTSLTPIDYAIKVASMIALVIGNIARAKSVLDSSSDPQPGKVKKFAMGGLLPGPSHGQGGMNLVGPYGQIYGNVEGGEALLSKRAYANNRGIIDALLNSGGAPLNYERVMQATTSREERRSFVATPGNTQAAAVTQNTPVQAGTERLDRIEDLLLNFISKQAQVNAIPVINSRRVQEQEDARILQIKDEVNA